MNEEKKWKRGDIGPDGRVFWKYKKSYKNGEYWASLDQFEKLKDKKRDEKKQSLHRIRYERPDIYREMARKKVKTKRLNRLKKTFQKISPNTLQEFYNLLNSPSHTISAIFSLVPNKGQTLAELIYELSGYEMELCEQIANPPEPEPTVEPKPQPTADPQPVLTILPDLF
jgi:hypothetical protein